MIQQLVNAMALGSIYTLFSLGLSLSWGILNVLNLAHGAIFTVGALVAYLLTSQFAGLSLWVVLPVAVAVCATLAFLMELLAFGPIRRRSRNELDAEMRTLIASVAAASILVAVVGAASHEQAFPISDSLIPRHVFEIAGLRITNIQLIIFATAVGLSALLVLFVRKTKHGRALRAVAFDRTASGLVGISAGRLQGQAMALSGGLAGVAGVLLAIYLGSAEAHMGDPLLLKAFAIIILAGVGSLGGAVVFGFSLALLETIVGYSFGADVRDALAFGLILGILIIRPQGLVARAGWQRA